MTKKTALSLGLVVAILSAIGYDIARDYAPSPRTVQHIETPITSTFDPAPVGDTVTITLSDTSQALLDALTEKHLSEARTQALEAQRKEAQSRLELAPYTTENTQTTTVNQTEHAPQTDKHRYLLDNLVVKGIFSADSGTTAWLDIEEQLVPVSVGATIFNIHVTDITPHYVRFFYNGDTIDKYMIMSTDTIEEETHEP